MLLGRGYRDLGQWAQATECGRAGHRNLSPDRSRFEGEAWVLLGQMRSATGDLEGAFACHDNAISELPASESNLPAWWVVVKYAAFLAITSRPWPISAKPGDCSSPGGPIRMSTWHDADNRLHGSIRGRAAAGLAGPRIGVPPRRQVAPRAGRTARVRCRMPWPRRPVSGLATSGPACLRG